jgi:hypothetical protein
MARIWKEVHSGRAPGEFGQPTEAFERRTNNASLIPHGDMLVRVASFTFRFATVEQLRDCLAYYNARTHASSRIPGKKLISELGQDWRRLRSWEVVSAFITFCRLDSSKRYMGSRSYHRSKALELAEIGKL